MSETNKLKQSACLTCTGSNSLLCTASEGQGLKFTFDNVHDGATCQQEMFVDVKDIVPVVLNGNNACILSYGQTGEAKFVIHTQAKLLSQCGLRCST